MTVKFDRTCPAWDKNPEYRLMFIRQQQTYFKDLLKVRGYVTIVEVLNALTIPFDITSYLNRPFRDLVWLRDEDDVVEIWTLDKFKDGSVSLHINID